MAAQTKVVKIERGRFGAQFQLARALMSAASATSASDLKSATSYLDQAIMVLTKLRLDLSDVW